MGWHLTSERRDAIVLTLLSKALKALEASADEASMREASHWVGRATEIMRELTDPLSPCAESDQIELVEEMLARISAVLRTRRLERTLPEFGRAGHRHHIS